MQNSNPAKIAQYPSVLRKITRFAQTAYIAMCAKNVCIAKNHVIQTLARHINLLRKVVICVKAVLVQLFPLLKTVKVSEVLVLEVIPC